MKRSQIPELAAGADAFVIHVPSRPDLYRYGISPNKLFDYLAAGRPLVMAADGDISMTDEAGCGVTVTPGDPSLLADAIVAMADLTDEERARLGKRGRAHVESNYGFESLAKTFKAVLEDSIEAYERRNGPH